LVLRLYQETVHDFILLFMPPCGPHFTPLATGSLKRSLLVFSTPRGHTGDDLSRLFFTCTNTSKVATCTCNTSPRISPHNIVNHSSHKEATIHRSSNHTWSSHRGIEANHAKVNAIHKMAKPSNKKDIMKLTGMMAALGRFISKLGEKGLPFFKLLKKADKFMWDNEA
jgi:hypothetical protein